MCATVCPGIRPADASVGDQKRVVTPKDAINKGAHYLVVGRPITKAENPSESANNIVKEIENAYNSLINVTVHDEWIGRCKEILGINN